MGTVTETEQGETDQRQQVREIGHEEYDPIGTLILIGMYFLLLAVLWLFMYFVEFAGNGPTPVGSIATGLETLSILLPGVGL